MILHHRGFPIRKSTGRSLFAAHRSLSQLVTSFIGSWCQGIPFMLLLAWTSVYCHQYICSLAWIAVYHVFQLLNFFALAKLNFFTLLERPDFKLICYLCLFPFLLYLSLFVYLNSSLLLFGFQWTFACFRLRLSLSRLSGFITTQFLKYLWRLITSHLGGLKFRVTLR